MKKNVLITALAVSCGLLATVASACGKKAPEQERTLMFEVAEDIALSYYEYCVVPQVVGKDNQGNLYYPSVTVKDANGETVIVEDNKFFVLYESDYTFEYAITFNNERIVKTTKGKVFDLTAPEIKLPFTDMGVFVGESLQIPTITVSDNKDEVTDLTSNIKVMFGAQEIPVTDGAFVPTEEGDYKIVYTVSDKANNLSEKTINVGVFEKEEGNIAYLSDEYGQRLCDLGAGLGSTFEGYATGKMASPEGEFSTCMKINTGSSPEGGRLDIKNPAIKDITPYKYIYLWVYTDCKGGMRLDYNNVWKGTRTDIKENVWTRIVFERGNDGNYYSEGTDDTRENAMKSVFDLSSDIKPTDISGFSINFVPLTATGNVQVYFGDFKACNELPALPEGTVDWKASPQVVLKNIPSASFKDKTINFSYDVLNVDNVTVNTYVVNNGNTTQLTSTNYTFTDLGEYTFIVEAVKDGNVIAKASKSVQVIEFTEGVVVDFTRADAVSTFGVAGQWNSNLSNSTTLTYPVTGQNSTTYVKLVDTINNVAGFKCSNPVITDVTEYEYAYIDVYVESDTYIMWRDSKAWKGSVENARYKIALTGNKWNRIIFEKNIHATNGSIRLELQDSGVVYTQLPTSFGTTIIQCGTSFYMGGMYACNELPTLPEGMVIANQEYGAITPSNPPATDNQPATPTAILVNGSALKWREEWGE